MKNIFMLYINLVLFKHNIFEEPSSFVNELYFMPIKNYLKKDFSFKGARAQKIGLKSTYLQI